MEVDRYDGESRESPIRECGRREGLGHFWINMTLTFSSRWSQWSAAAPPEARPPWWSSESGTGPARSAPSPDPVAAGDQRSIAPVPPA